MLLILLFLIIPFLSLPIIFMIYCLDKKSKGILYSILIGIIFGLFAYYFIPQPTYDLNRHQHIVELFNNKSFSNFLLLKNNINLEILPQLYSFLISKIGNIDLLQFGVVSVGYSLLFFMLYDYRKKVELNNLSFIIIVLFIFFGFHAINFISGLYYYIAIIVFAFAFYLENVLNKKKTAYLLYFITLFIHDSMFFAFLILLLFKLFKNRFNIKTVLVGIIIFIFSVNILEFLNSLFNIEIINKITHLYTAYTEKDDYFRVFYSGMIFPIELSKLLLTLMCIFIQKERKKFEDINGFILLISLLTSLMMIRSLVMIRFIMLIQFIGIIPIMDTFSKTINKKKALLLFIMCLLLFVYIMYFIKLFSYQNFGNLFSDKFVSDIFHVIMK